MLPALIAGAASIGGGLIARDDNRESQRRQMEFQAEQARLAREEAQTGRDWSERMSSTEMQRRVADLTAAGLNPAMAMSSGHGATTPSASISGAAPAGAGANFQDVLGPGISNAMSAKRLAMDVEAFKWDLNQKEANIQKTKAEAQTSINAGGLIEAQTEGLRMEQLFRSQEMPYALRQRAAEALLRELEQPGAQNEAEFNRRLGIWRPALGAIGATARGAAEIFGKLRVRPPIGGQLRYRSPYDPNR